MKSIVSVVSILLVAFTTMISSSSVDAEDTFYWLISEVNGREILKINPDGSKVTTFYAPQGLPQGTCIAFPEIDSQGRIAFHVSSDCDSGPLYWGVAGTNEFFPLASTYRDIPVGTICWIPGTNYVLFSNKWSGIHRIDLDPATNDETVITSNYFDEVMDVTHTGKVFFDNSMYRLPGRFFTMNLDGTNIHEFDPFGDDLGESGQVSPDDQCVALNHMGMNGIWLANMDASLITPFEEPLTDKPPHVTGRGWIAWSPDSQTVAFVADNELWSINKDGTNLRQITKGQFTDVRVWGVAPANYRYFAVIAGVADYPGTDDDLEYPDDDAMDIRNSLRLYSNWSDDNIQLLLNSEANKSNIKTAIEKMGSMADSDDICLLFFSGHGTHATDISPIDESDGLDEYICSYGSSLNEYIRDDELSDWLGNLPTTNVAVILDTCYSGGQIKVVDGFTPKVLPGTTGVVQKGDGFVADITRRIHVDDMDDNEGCVVLAACDDDELSWEFGGLENGLFTYFVVKGLEKNVDKNENGELSAEETGKYAKSIVNLLNKILPFLKQHPQLYDDYPAGTPQSDELSICLGEPQPATISHAKDIEDIARLAAAPAIVAMPQKPMLLQNYSNPFNPDTWIPYQLSEGTDVIIKIYNGIGQLVRVLDLGHKSAGYYLTKDKAAYWDGKDSLGEKVASGVYFYTLQTGEFRATKKMVIMK
ncbi:hypothetical protein FJZ31_37545 [Candidatus Poribacteria bacterium]|nr:hypothetical protein [Candidatus Poribacteria bacterium]